MQDESAPPQTSSMGFAIASLVIGVIALLCGFVALLSVPLGITAIVLGIVAIRKHAGKGMGIAGIITGALAVIIGLLATLLVFMAVPALQRNQRDTQVKNDVSQAASAVYSHMANNQGVIPSAEQFQSGEFTSQYLSDLDTNITYTPGLDCDGVSSTRSFTVSAKLSNGTDYCLD